MAKDELVFKRVEKKYILSKEQYMELILKRIKAVIFGFILKKVNE